MIDRADLSGAVCLAQEVTKCTDVVRNFSIAVAEIESAIYFC